MDLFGGISNTFNGGLGTLAILLAFTQNAVWKCKQGEGELQNLS